MPQTLYLESQSKASFIQKMDLDNSRQEIISNIDILIEEMDLNYKLSYTQPFMYKMTTNDVMKYHKNIAWIIGFIINIVCLITLKLDGNIIPDAGERKLESDTWLIWINIASYIFSFYTLLMFLFWLLFKAPIQ